MSKFKSILDEKQAKLVQTLGLSEAQVAVYLAALELGQANVQEISRKSGVKRTSIYNFIDSLKERQFLSEIKKGKRRLYSAANPASLIQIEKSRLASLEQLVPSLLAINNAESQKPKVTYHEGVDGMQEIYNQMLHDKQTIYVWEDLDRMFSIMPEGFTTNYPIERTRLKIPVRAINRDSKFSREWTAKNNERYMRESRFVSAEEFGTDIEIFGNKVALISLRKDSPFGVLIQDPGLARTLKIIWQEQWGSLTPVSGSNT